MSDFSKHLCVALDTPSLDEASAFAGALAGRADFLKVGLELYTAVGPKAVRKLRELDYKVFLDLKLHDIPNTVARAVAQAAGLGASLITLHACGGPEMIQKASEAAKWASERLSVEPPKLLAVTVLTSIDRAMLSNMLGLDMPTEDLVLKLARMAMDSGADGVVCSAREVARVKQECGSDFFTVTPGIRPEGTVAGDQKRVTTPAEAVRAGSDLLVVGRPITGAENPAEAAETILVQIEGALL